jgi:hypothetical protein
MLKALIVGEHTLEPLNPGILESSSPIKLKKNQKLYIRYFKTI